MQLLDIYTLFTLGFLLLIAVYWIRFFTNKHRGPIGVAHPTKRDPHGKGNLAAAYAFDESFSPGAPSGIFGPIPVRKKRERRTPETYRKDED